MDPVLIGLLGIGLLVIFLILGVHVAVGMIVTSLIGVLWITGSFTVALNILGNTTYAALMDYMLGAIPMFIIMGMLIIHSGSSEELYDVASGLFGRLKGGVAIGTVVANAIFAAVTGVSMASTVVFSKVAVPEMTRLGYNFRFAIGTVAGSSVLGMLIPPSVLLILFGILAEESIGKLFLAGIIPGIILALVYCLGILLMVTLRPNLAKEAPPKVKVPRNVRRMQILGTSSLAAIIVLVIGGIYGGFFTATEAGAAGAFLALVLTIIRRKCSASRLSLVMLETGDTLAGVYMLFIGACLFSRMLTLSGLPAEITAFVSSVNVGATTIICLFLIVIILMGCILDSASIMFICLPLMVPVLNALSIDLIWFGVLCIIAVELGLLTPPFGMLAYGMPVMLDGCTIADVFIGSIPFEIMMLLVIGLLLLFPSLCTWLPGLM